MEQSYKKNDELSIDLQHVRWLGGGSGAGKSTLAGILAVKYGFRLYSTDDMQASHSARSNPIDHPLLHRFIKMTMDERWIERTPEEMFRTFHGFQGEGFELLLEDILALPTDMPILVEGYKLLPRLVAPLLSSSNQAIWLIPKPEFRRTAMTSRGSLWSIAGRTSNPRKALENLLARDALYTEEILKQATILGLTTIKVDGSLSVDELATHVAQCFGIEQ